jgi:UDP-N-acetylglucosamine--N-acetylmuramyl-(pentapeptide) pyrophosphoryl-undecaprenol N-acetylglucosamine transferase
METVGDELADVFALAALVVGRSGAGTVAELAALGKPSILIPLPGTGGDEATKNARVLADAHAAILIPQAEASPELIASHILALKNDPDRLARMGDAALALAPREAAHRIADEILSLARLRGVR